jgi:hypothetical protein
MPSAPAIFAGVAISFACAPCRGQHRAGFGLAWPVAGALARRRPVGFGQSDNGFDAQTVQEFLEGLRF